MKKWLLVVVLLAFLLSMFVSVSIYATGGISYLSFLRIGGSEGSFIYMGGTALSRLFIGWAYVPPSPDTLHIISLSPTAITLSWQDAAPMFTYSELTYKVGSYPTTPGDGTVAYYGLVSSATVDNLTPGNTYYFGVWTECGGLYSANGAFCTATTTAGHGLPDDGTDAGGEEDETILQGSPVGGLIDFVSAYGQLPAGTVGLMGYSSLLIFMLVAVACYNRSVAMTVICGVAGMALGRQLGVFSTIFLVIAIIIGLAIGSLRGGQPTGG